MQRLAGYGLECSHLLVKLRACTYHNGSLGNGYQRSVCYVAPTAVIGYETAHALSACAGSQDNGAVLYCQVLRLVVKSLDGGVHGQAYLNHITVLPLALYSYV